MPGLLLNPYRYGGPPPFVGDALTTPALVNVSDVDGGRLILTESGVDVLHLGHLVNVSAPANPTVGSYIHPPSIRDASDWEQIAQLTAPTSGAFTFAGLSLANYARVELWLQGIQTGTTNTKVLVRLRYAGPTTMAHDYAIRNLTSADGSSSSVSGAAATDGKIAGNNSTTYALQNNSQDSLAGVIGIDNPGASGLRKMLTWSGGFFNSGASEAMFAHAIVAVTETNPITEIVILGNNNLTAGKATLVGLTHP